jgi:hypothetical protein
MQHKDREGKLISMYLLPSFFCELFLTSFLADPDQSNPTRNRLERPLDTIRSFDAAIDAHRKQQRM